MSEVGCEIHYKVDSERHDIFRKVVEKYCSSEKSEMDSKDFKNGIKDIGLDETYVLSEGIYDCTFVCVDKINYEMHFFTRGLYWDETIIPLLHDLGCKAIYAYIHDTSWGGDIFAKNKSGETEYLYMSQRDSDLDSFLFDKDGDYIGTTYDQLYSMYLDKMFKPIDFGQSQKKESIVSDYGDEKTISTLKNISWPKVIIFFTSLCYLIWHFLIK